MGGGEETNLSRADLRRRPWTRRPRRSVRQVLGGPGWRLAIFPFIVAPLMAGKVLWSLWGGTTPSGAEWGILIVSLGPWLWLCLWLRRPTAR